MVSAEVNKGFSRLTPLSFAHFSLSWFPTAISDVLQEQTETNFTVFFYKPLSFKLSVYD